MIAAELRRRLVPFRELLRGYSAERRRGWDEGVATVLVELDALLLAATPSVEPAGMDIERLDLADELLDADHEIAAFLHGFIWPSFKHVNEPGDGDDCHECYAQTEKLRSLILAALPTQASDSPEKTT